MPTDEQISSAIALALKHFRSQRNFSQIYLSENSGIHRTMIEKIETSKRKPTYHTLIKLCSVLEITVSEFSELVEKNLKF